MLKIIKDYSTTYISISSKGSYQQMTILLSVFQVDWVHTTELIYGRGLGTGRSKLRSDFVLPVVEGEFPNHVRHLGTSILWKSVVKNPQSLVYPGSTTRDFENVSVGISKGLLTAIW